MHHGRNSVFNPVFTQRGSSTSYPTWFDKKKKKDLSDYRCSSSSSQLSTTVVRRIRLVRVCVCVCVQLTYVDPAAVALHQQQHKHVKRDEVDDEDVSAPGRHLWSKTKITVCETGNQHVAPQIQKFMLACGQRMSSNLQPNEPKIEPQPSANIWEHAAGEFVYFRRLLRSCICFPDVLTVIRFDIFKRNHIKKVSLDWQSC